MLLRIPRVTTVQPGVCVSRVKIPFLYSIRAIMSLFTLPGGILHTFSYFIWKKKNWTAHYLLYHCSIMNFDFDPPMFQKECEYKNCLFKARMENINKSFCWEVILLNWLRTYYVHIQGGLTIQFSALYNLCNKEKIATL